MSSVALASPADTSTIPNQERRHSRSQRTRESALGDPQRPASLPPHDTPDRLMLPITILPNVSEYGIWYSLGQLDVNSRILYNNSTYTFLPELIQQAGPNSAIYQAMRSVGTMNLSNRSLTVDMTWLVEWEYSRAVSTVHAALRDTNEYLKDTTLVAVWLLVMREVLGRPHS